MKHNHSFKDRARVRVTSADIWGSIRLLNDASIPVFHVQEEEPLIFSFDINRKDYPVLRTLLEKRGDRIVLVQKSRLHFFQQSILRRPVLYTGLILFFGISFFLPTRILVIEVEGNQRIPSRKILEAAENTGIKLFASCAQVRSEKMKNELLCAIPELQWAGINTQGSKAVISVRERADIQKGLSNSTAVSSVIAERDGIIQSITALKGTVHCKEGQAVTKGQVLISGYTDCGICIRAERAEGEVYAQTLRSIQAVTPSVYRTKGPSLRQRQQFSILLGKKRINFWKGSGIWDSTCGRIEKEYRLTLPGGIPLPIAIVCDTLTWYETDEGNVEIGSARSALTDFSRNYISSQMIAGIITHTDEVWKTEPGRYLLSGQYLCSEMIGRERLENGVQNEQSD